MIELAIPVQFDRQSTSGRTRPGFITCEDGAGVEVELVAKLSAGCDLGITALAMEAICACLAGDLGLPVPQPYFIRMDAEWINSIADTNWAGKARASCSVAFGSKRLPAGYAQWITPTTLVGEMTQAAGGVLLFDAIIDNPDRRVDNPNCLVKGDQIRIIDHELALSPVVLLGWKPPWQVGALHHLENPGAHIFREALHRKEVDWEPIKAKWLSLSNQRLQEYINTLPTEWSAAIDAAQCGVEKVRNARDNIDGCVTEVRRLIG